MSFNRYAFAFGLLVLGLMSCSEPSEAPRVVLPLYVDGAGIIKVQNDMGYDIEVTSARAAINDVVFTVSGEVHQASMLSKVYDVFVPSVHAHPGHYEGGEVTGEMRGQFVFDWLTPPAEPLGDATLIAAKYTAANFTFGRGDADVLGADDPLVDHTALISGTATRGDRKIEFTFVLDSPMDRKLVGVPFEANIKEGAKGVLTLQLNLKDAQEGDTLFDGIDFELFDMDGDGKVRVAPDNEESVYAYNLFRRAFQTHDHFSVHYVE